ncbi:UbiA prenyltransferase family [Aspergillus sergii]|uniref:UbiA prenyltransferase family n=1 Tax=Aspergillus sergii TaxID=1034303 RepID=A0A5N6WJE6_9EURO|nr:UbiA prenyltransferase family [Aspergillus sergii]
MSVDGLKYTPPRHGFFALMPQAWVPYAELMRLDRLAGCYFYYLHYAIGLGFAACVSPTTPDPMLVLRLATSFMLWVVVFRGTMCSWNDIVDGDLDRQVARTRFRPISRGAVNLSQSCIFLLLELCMCGLILIYCLPSDCLFYVAITTVMALIYPFCKRVTNYPQVFLGLGFGVSIFTTGAALGVDIMKPRKIMLDTLILDHQRWATLCLFGFSVCYTVLLDTLYAYQDVVDDVKAGVMSLAVRLGQKSHISLAALAVTQIVCLVAVGCLSQLSAMYFIASCGGATVVLACLLFRVDLSDPASCAWWFGPGSCFLGGVIALGLTGEYLLRYLYLVMGA